MASIRDHIIQGTAQVEEVLRDHGTWGRSFPELVQNLATRENMPRRVRSKALGAHRMRERAARDLAPIHDFELHEWTQGINALLDWVRSRDEQSASPSVDDARATEPRPRTNILSRWLRPREARPWKLEAWMLIAGFVLVVAVAGGVLRAVTTRASPENMTAEQALDGIEPRHDQQRSSHGSDVKAIDSHREKGAGSRW
jgi:hypothetical protein